MKSIPENNEQNTSGHEDEAKNSSELLESWQGQLSSKDNESNQSSEEKESGTHTTKEANNRKPKQISLPPINYELEDEDESLGEVLRRLLHQERSSGHSHHRQKRCKEEKTGQIQWVSTIRQSACRNRGPIQLADGDIVYAQPKKKAKRGIYFIVDASGSMAAKDRLSIVQSYLASLVQTVYEERDFLSVITFRGKSAKVTAPLTKDVHRISEALETVKLGGRTPLHEGLALAYRMIEQDLAKEVVDLAYIVLITDGKVNVEPIRTCREQALITAQSMKPLIQQAIVIDTDKKFIRTGIAKDIATTLEAIYIKA